MFEEVVICPVCDGRGMIYDKECPNPDCKDGIIKSNEEIIKELKGENNVSKK